jgi:hypothetical protein
VVRISAPRTQKFRISWIQALINRDSSKYSFAFSKTANLLPQPGQPMANLLLQPAQPLLAPVHHSTYSSFYSDTVLDPFQGNYTRVLERMDPEVNNAISHVMLLEQAVGGSPVPQAYLCCSLRRNPVRVFCIHLPSRYISLLDGNPTP